jgi:dGTPase
VFVNHEGDMFRTRLTHSIEVAQIARTIARALRVNEDLTEAIALAHDLGHTPFGHAGQEALNECMQPYGGFEHNLHSLRIVDVLEERYAEFRGLNLLFETREGILKHCSIERARDLGELGERFIKGMQASVEAQIANVADEIAYNHHDIDDGLRSNLLEIEHLRELDLFDQTYREACRRSPRASDKLAVYTVIREMLNFFVVDLIGATEQRIEAAGIRSVEDVRRHDGPCVDFSDATRAMHAGFKRLLRRHLYEHKRVQRMAHRAHEIVTALFDAFMSEPELLPGDKTSGLGGNGRDTAPIVADYIAGMTDRFAISEYGRGVGPRRSG